MTTAAAAVYLVSDAHRDAANKLFNMIYLREGAEDQIGTMNFGRAVVAKTDPATITHWVGSCPATAEWESWFRYLPAKFAAGAVVPAGGSWPWIVEGEEYLTEADALAAATDIYINVNQGEDVEPLAMVNIATVFEAKGLQYYEWPEE